MLYAASIDRPEDNLKFSRLNGYPFVLLSDPDKKLSRTMGVLSPTGLYARRWTYVIDDRGIIRYVDRSVNPSTSARDLLKRLGELGVPKKAVR